MGVRVRVGVGLGFEVGWISGMSAGLEIGVGGPSGMNVGEANNDGV